MESSGGQRIEEGAWKNRVSEKLELVFGEESYILCEVDLSMSGKWKF